MIILEKVRKKEILLKGIMDTIAPAKMAWVLSRINLAGRYNWAMSNVNLNIAKELGQTGIKKY